jgi:iduronate 2-sulfatase
MNRLSLRAALLSYRNKLNPRVVRLVARTLALALALPFVAHAASTATKPNVLFIIADDLTLTALSCYGNPVVKTPNIDRLAAQGTRFTRAYCNGTYCGPSRASFMSGYYPHATGVLGYTNPRPQIGDRATWSQHFMQAGYRAARVSKIYHMGVPGDIDEGTGRDHNSADDPASWHERYNSPGPEWKARGDDETLENNPDGKKPAVGGNTFVVVAADGDDLVHSDGKTAAKAVELIEGFAQAKKTAPRGGAQPFFLAVGFVRPHVPFVSPKAYHEPFLPYDKLPLPPKYPGAWDGIPKAGINYKTSENMKMDVRRQKKAIGGYYAAVAFMDAQVGKVLDALKKSGLEDDTIVIFTSDHGFHLGEHDFWAKVSLREESAQVPLIIKVPGRKAAVCNSLVELIDLYPTTARLCGLEVPARLQGKDISGLLDDPRRTVRDTAFSVAPSSEGFLLRDDRWSYIQYAEDASKGVELYDLTKDPKQYTNLAGKPEFAEVVRQFKAKLAARLHDVRRNDLGLTYEPPKPKQPKKKKA